MTEIWHNPRCSKSRDTLALITAQGITPQVRLYLKDPPGPDTLRKTLSKLGMAPREILRKGEAAYRELNLSDATDDQLIAAMAAHPILIERPIVIRGNRAAIGRPPRAVLDIL